MRSLRPSISLWMLRHQEVKMLDRLDKWEDAYEAGDTEEDED